MSITAGQPANASDFISSSAGASDAAKGVITDSSGQIDSSFIRGRVQQFLLGESFTGATTPQPGRIVNDVIQPLFDGATAFGSAALPQRALKIKPLQSVTVSSIRCQLSLTAATNPSTNMTVEIQTDSAGVPSGTAVTNGTSGTVATSTLPTSLTVILSTFTFSTPPVLSANTTYHIVIKTSATNANTINILTLTDAKKFSNFAGSSYNGTTWSSGQVLPSFECVLSAGGSYSLWVSDANGVEPLNHSDGFVITTGSALATGKIVSAGTIRGFSGLLVNSDYYLSNTAGTITINRNEGLYMGTAVNATTIEMPTTLVGVFNDRSYRPMTYDTSSVTYIGCQFMSYCNGNFISTASISGLNATQMLNYIYLTDLTTATGHINATSYTSGTFYATATIPARKGQRVYHNSSAIAGAGTMPSINALYFQPIS